MSEFISIDEALYCQKGYLDVIDASSFLSKDISTVLSILVADNHISYLPNQYAVYPVIRLNKDSLNSNIIKVRPTFNDERQNVYHQLLISVEYLKTKQV